jgi:membrane protease YdiL (CAAX protease family)
MSNPVTNHRTWFRDNRLLWGLILVVLFSILRFTETTSWKNLFGSPGFQETIPFALFLLFWFVILSIGLIVAGIVWLTKTSWRELGWKREGLFKSIGLGLAGFILIYINVIIWAMLAGNTKQPTFFVPSITRFLLVLFFGFGLAAWVEENLFRGYLQPLLANRMNIWFAIIVQAAIFSAAHIGYSKHLTDFGFTFVTGLILGLLRFRESSLVAPFIAHGLFWMMGAFMIVAP